MPELAVIVPTYNERDNVSSMVHALERALAGVDFEVIFVDDDSPDGTAAAVRSLSQTNPRVRIVQRINRRGLASAAVEGMMATSAPYLAVIDGDLQHDETILPEMLRKLKTDHLDIVIGTRNTDGGGMGSFSSSRVKLSNLGRAISSFVSHADVSDPMSGYFLLTRAYLEEVVRSLSSVGFKILLDLLASSRRQVRSAEIGYTFRNRTAGESKLTAAVCLEYVELLLEKLVGNWVPVRYAFYALVGCIGLVVQILFVFGALRALPFLTAQMIGSVATMVLNYVLNNQLTFRARRLQGWAWFTGLLWFALACSIGLYSNLQVAQGLRGVGTPWPLASLAGIFVGSVWNYGVSSMIVWRVNRRYRRLAATAAVHMQQVSHAAASSAV
jgi:dolichol-phosphate mannosyltransferase